MNTVKLPHSDVTINKAVFGTSRIGGTIERYNKRESIGILRSALDAGIRTFDTADIYAQGNSEHLLAEAFRGQRDRVVIATKGGYVLNAKAKILAKVKPFIRPFMKFKPGLTKCANRARGAQMTRDFSRAYLTGAVESSLRRLKTDTIDIYQLHSPTAADLDGSDAFDTLAELKQAGKIRSYGVSLLSLDDLQLCTGKGVSMIQIKADLWNPSSHAAAHQLAATDRILLVARQVFGGGILSSHPDSLTAADFGDNPEALKRARHFFEVVTGKLDPHEAILRYFHHHAPFGAFLFATTRQERLQQNLSRLSARPLDPDLLENLHKAFGHQD